MITNSYISYCVGGVYNIIQIIVQRDTMRTRIELKKVFVNLKPAIDTHNNKISAPSKHATGEG